MHPAPKLRVSRAQMLHNQLVRYAQTTRIPTNRLNRSRVLRKARKIDKKVAFKIFGDSIAFVFTDGTSLIWET